MPRPACLVREDRELKLYLPQPHDAEQLAKVSRSFDRCVEAALGSGYEYAGITVGDTLRRDQSVSLPNCSTLVASLEWRDGGEQRPFTHELVKVIGEELNVEYQVSGTAYARVVYDPETSLKAGIIVTIERDESCSDFVILPNHGRLPYSTVVGADVELYPSKVNAGRVHFVAPGTPRHTSDHSDTLRLAAHVANQLDIFLLEVPPLIDSAPQPFSDNFM